MTIPGEAVRIRKLRVVKRNADHQFDHPDTVTIEFLDGATLTIDKAIARNGDGGHTGAFSHTVTLDDAVAVELLHTAPSPPPAATAPLATDAEADTTEPADQAEGDV